MAILLKNSKKLIFWVLNFQKKCINFKRDKCKWNKSIFLLPLRLIAPIIVHIQAKLCQLKFFLFYQKIERIVKKNVLFKTVLSTFSTQNRHSNFQMGWTMRWSTAQSRKSSFKIEITKQFSILRSVTVIIRILYASKCRIIENCVHHLFGIMVKNARLVYAIAVANTVCASLSAFFLCIVRLYFSVSLRLFFTGISIISTATHTLHFVRGIFMVVCWQFLWTRCVNGLTLWIEIRVDWKMQHRGAWKLIKWPWNHDQDWYFSCICVCTSKQ